MEINKFFKLDEEILTITIDGEFNRDLSILVQEKLDGYEKTDIKKIIFDLKDMTFVASSGLRIFIYAQEEITPNVEVIVTNAKNLVKKVINMSGVKGILNIIE
jgi:anti-anti-sigma factor